MTKQEYSEKRADILRKYANEYAALRTLQAFLELSPDNLTSDEYRYFSNGVCSTAEGRYNSLKVSDLIDGRFLHDSQIVAELKQSTVSGLHPWLSTYADGTSMSVLIKNPQYTDIITKIIGQRNALVVYQNYAFIGHLLYPDHVCVVRPALRAYQEPLVNLFNTIQSNVIYGLAEDHAKKEL